MSLGTFAHNRPIATKVAAGVLTLSLLLVAVGLAGYRGIDSLGRSVEMTGKSSALLVGVNGAVVDTNQFIENHETKASQLAQASLAQVLDGLHAIGEPSDPQLIPSYQAIGSFNAAIDQLKGAAVEIDTSTDQLMRTLGVLRSMGAQIQADGFTQADVFSQEQDKITQQLDRMREISVLISQFQIGMLRSQQLLTQSIASSSHDEITQAMSKIGSAIPLWKKVEQMGVTESGKAKAEVVSGQLTSLFGPIGVLRGSENPDEINEVRQTVLKALGDIVLATEAVGKLQSQAVYTATFKLQAASAQRVDAIATSKLGLSFSDKIAGLTGETINYQKSPTDAAKEIVVMLADNINELAADIKKAGLGDADATIKEFRDSFEKLSQAIQSFAAAKQVAREQSLLSSHEIERVVRERAAEAAVQQRSSLWGMVITGGLAVAFALMISFVLTRLIARPIARLTVAMGRLAAGELDMQLDSTERADEIGGMISAVKVFRDNAIERVRLTEIAQKEQQDRLRRQVRVETLIDQFRGEMSKRLQLVLEQAGRMEQTARHLSSDAGDASIKTDTANGESTAASRSVNTVAAAAEELSTSISEIAQQLGTAKGTVDAATSNARATDSKISDLAQAASRIGQVVSLIRAIADQTNLLALNATIEAARAGDAGRGFAVVAGEVKNLANQTAKATDEIAGQVTAIQSSTDGVVEAIRVIVANMEDVHKFTGSIADSVNEQGTATGEIARNVHEAAAGTAHVADAVAVLKRSVAQTAKSAEDVLRLSGDVSGQATDLRGIVEGFLTEVAAA